MRAGTAFLVLLGVGILLSGGCGELRPLPATFEAPEYAPITYEELLAPGKAGLKAGQKVKVPAFFWEFLTYDPAMARNYLTLPRYPLRWYQMEWFATYGTPQMQGYYDLAALDRQQQRLYKLKRLDPIMLYGELSSLAPGLYLRVHHIEKIEEE
jgi:hypothetical protein